MASNASNPFSFGNTSTSHYSTLNVPRTATSDDIRRAFKQKARFLHPDKSGEENTQRFQELVHARDTLLNEVKRSEYDDEHDDDCFVETSGALLCGPRLSEHFKGLFFEWKSSFACIPKSSFRKFPNEFQEMIQKFSTGFYREQCDRANPKAIGYNSPTGQAGSSSSAHSQQTRNQRPLEETINFVTQAAIEIETECGDKRTKLSRVYRQAIERGHTSNEDDDLAPIVDFSTSPREHVQTLLDELSPDEPEILQRMSPPQLLGRLLRYIPTKPVDYLKTTSTQSESSGKCGQCQKAFRYLNKPRFTCVDCAKQFCKHCPIDSMTLYGYRSRGGQYICTSCIQRLYQQHAKEWVKQASSFIQAGTLQDLKAAFGCVSIAVSLWEEVNLLPIAKELLQCDLPELALPLALAIEQQSSDTIDKIKANKFLSSVLRSLANRHSDRDVKWTMLVAAKDAALMAASEADYVDEALVDASTLYTAVKELNTELQMERAHQEDEMARLTSFKRREIDRHWANRDFTALIKATQPPEDEGEVDYSLEALEGFIRGMEKFLPQMRPDDRYSIQFFRGILKLYKKRYVEGIADVEQVAWHAHSSELLRKESVHILLSLLQQGKLPVFKLDGLQTMLTDQLLTTQNKSYDDFTTREHQLLCSDDSITPPFNTNWPGLSVVGLNLRAHRKCEAAFEKQLREKTWGHQDVGYAYIDYIQGCSHPAEIAISCLHASMWFLKDLDQKLKPSEKFPLKKIILTLLGSAFAVAHRSFHPGMQLYMGRTALGVAIETLKRAKDVAEPEDTEIVSALLHMVTYNSRFVPFWNFPTVPVSEAALLSIISAELHSQYLDQLTDTAAANRPMTEGELRYQLYENDLRYVHQAEDSQGVHITAMEELLAEKGWAMSDVTNLMTSPLSPRDEEGWLIQQPRLGVQLEFAEIKGMIIDLDNTHPSIQLVVVPANPSRGRMGIFSQTDFQHVLSMVDQATGTLFFSLDQPDSQKRFHPFQEFRYTTEDLYKSDLLHTLFETDYLMKSFSVGSDVSAQPPFKQRPNKEGLTKNLPQHLQEKLKPVSERGATQNRAHRFWIQADKIIYSEDQVDSKLEIRLGEIEMKIRSHPLMPGEDGTLKDTKEDDDPDSPEAKFAADMTEVYNELGLHFPMFLRLKQLAKLQVLGLFLRGILAGMREKANGEGITVPEELYQRIRRDALQQVKEQIKSGLDSVSTDIGAWPTAEDSSTVSSEVNRILRELPYNVHASYYDVEPHVESALRKKDESVVTQLVDALMGATDNRLRRYTLTGHVRSWLRYRSQRTQNELLDYVGSGASLPTREMLKSQIISVYKERYRNFSRLLNRLSLPNKVTTSSPCKWVPAALHKEEDGTHLSLCYGGVLISPKVEQGRVSRFPAHTQRVHVAQRTASIPQPQLSGMKARGTQKKTSIKRQSAQRSNVSFKKQTEAKPTSQTATSGPKGASQGATSSNISVHENGWNFTKTWKKPHEQIYMDPGKQTARALQLFEDGSSCILSGASGGTSSASGSGRGGGSVTRGETRGGKKRGGGSSKKSGAGGESDGGGGGNNRKIFSIATAAALLSYTTTQLYLIFGKKKMKTDSALKKFSANLDLNPQCERPDCKACSPNSQLQQTTNSSSDTTNESGSIPFDARCALYGIFCLITGKVYIGMTTRQAIERIKEHLRDIAKEKNLTLPKHFNKYFTNKACYGRVPSQYMKIKVIKAIPKKIMEQCTPDEQRTIMLEAERFEIAKVVQEFGRDKLLNRSIIAPSYERVEKKFHQHGKAPPPATLFKATATVVRELKEQILD